MSLLTWEVLCEAGCFTLQDDFEPCPWTPAYVVGISTKHQCLVSIKHDSSICFALEFNELHKAMRIEDFQIIDVSKCNPNEDLVKYRQGKTIEYMAEHATIKVPMTSEQRDLLAKALKLTQMDMPAYDPCNHSGRLSDVRLCPLTSHVSLRALCKVKTVLNLLVNDTEKSLVFPLSYGGDMFEPYMALRTFSRSDDGDKPTFQGRLTVCHKLAPLSIANFDETVFSAMGFKKEAM